SFLDRLINLVQIIPWWAVALVGLLLYIGISSLNDPERRDVLDYLADRPKISTTELFEVTLRIEKPVLVVDESFLVVDLNESRSIIPASLVESRAEGTIFCPPDAPTGCLSQRGMVITYRDYRIPAGRTPDGVDVAT